MKNYVKPMILANEELAEGVYAGSGASAGTNDVTATATQSGSDGQKTIWFNVDFKNNSSEAVTNWSATITFNGEVDSASVDNCTVSVNGNTITVKPARNWNATINVNTPYTSSGWVTGKNALLQICS